MELELLEDAGFLVEHIRPDLEAMGSAAKVIVGDLEAIDRCAAAPHAAERMVLARDQSAARLQDAGGLSVVATEVRHPDRDVAAREHHVERRIGQHRQIDDIGANESDVEAESGSPLARDRQLRLGNIDARHPGAQTCQGEDNLVVAAAQHGNALAGDVVEPFQLRWMERQGRVAVGLAPAYRHGVPRRLQRPPSGDGWHRENRRPCQPSYR